jgi:hypothetical protein
LLFLTLEFISTITGSTIGDGDGGESGGLGKGRG